MGGKIRELGICPAAVDIRLNGINGGNCGGRACWALVGTFCGGKVQGTYAEKFGACSKCEFFRNVVQEEGASLVPLKDILSITLPPE